MSGSDTERALDALLQEVRACRICAGSLPHGPRPVLRARASARLLIVGQAPGARVHETGIPWNDPSGDRLRAWMAIDRDTFYDESRIAIIPAGLCYPGTLVREVDGAIQRGGDLPPRPECAPLWLERLLALLPNIQLTLLAGRYAHELHLGPRVKTTLSDTVAAWRDYLPGYLPLPHPSFRNLRWLRDRPWFQHDLLPDLRRRVHAILNGDSNRLF